jgi:hypothetical protein
VSHEISHLTSHHLPIQCGADVGLSGASARQATAADGAAEHRKAYLLYTLGSRTIERVNQSPTVRPTPRLPQGG